MDRVEIPMERNDDSWRLRCYDLMDRLNPPSEPRLLQEELCREKYSMIFELQKAVQNGSVDNFLDVLEQVPSEWKSPLSPIFDQVTPAGDSLLHEAAYFGRENIAELICHHFPELLTKRNIKGDTALHVAARAKSSDVIKVILSQYEAQNKDEKLTRLMNQYGNTALHEAVYSKHHDGVTLLFVADKSVAHYLNKSGESPLYLAVLNSDREVVNVLLKVAFTDDKPLPKFHGNSPLHAAIYTRNSALMKEIVEKRSDRMYLRDEGGGTPLHYAAATGYLDGARVLLKKSTLATLELDSKGNLPIHLACKWGHVKVVKELLNQEWADSRVLLNRKGQNILHVAAKNGRENVVKYLLRNTKLRQLTLNEKDINGNTPLHLAANVYYNIVFTLTKEKSIDVNLTNNEGLTARDIVWVRRETSKTFGQRLVDQILDSAGAKMSDKAKKVLHKRRITPDVDRIKAGVKTLMLLAILIATVTFAAGFTVPGGVYSSDDPDPNKRGKAVLGDRTWFQVFVVSDMIAMYSSLSACSILFLAQLGDSDFGILCFAIANLGIFAALLAMFVVFLAAISLVESEESGPVNVISAIVLLSLSSISIIFFLIGTFPYASRIPVLHQVSKHVIKYLTPRAGAPKDKVKKLESSASEQAIGEKKG